MVAQFRGTHTVGRSSGPRFLPLVVYLAPACFLVTKESGGMMSFCGWQALSRGGLDSISVWELLAPWLMAVETRFSAM